MRIRLVGTVGGIWLDRVDEAELLDRADELGAVAVDVEAGSPRVTTRVLAGGKAYPAAEASLGERTLLERESASSSSSELRTTAP